MTRLVLPSIAASFHAARAKDRTTTSEREWGKVPKAWNACVLRCAPAPGPKTPRARVAMAWLTHEHQELLACQVLGLLHWPDEGPPPTDSPPCAQVAPRLAASDLQALSHLDTAARQLMQTRTPAASWAAACPSLGLDPNTPCYEQVKQAAALRWGQPAKVTTLRLEKHVTGNKRAPRSRLTLVSNEELPRWDDYETDWGAPGPLLPVRCLARAAGRALRLAVNNEEGFSGHLGPTPNPSGLSAWWATGSSCTLWSLGPGCGS